MKNVFNFALLVGITSLAGCASIVDGRSQEIVINTNPSGATCSLTRNDMPIGSVSPTPSAILIEKTKYDIIIKCNKEGYQEATYFNKSGSAGSTFGNIVLGGGIGWAIDSASGADNKYDSPVNITLPAEVADDESDEKPKHHHHKTTVAAEKTASTQTAAANTTEDIKPDVGQSVSGLSGAGDNSQSDYPKEK